MYSHWIQKKFPMGRSPWRGRKSEIYACETAGQELSYYSDFLSGPIVGTTNNPACMGEWEGEIIGLEMVAALGRKKGIRKVVLAMNSDKWQFLQYYWHVLCFTKGWMRVQRVWEIGLFFFFFRPHIMQRRCKFVWKFVWI